MNLEVEQKFPVQDVNDLVRKVVELGGTWSAPQWQQDTYLAHPTRDFAATDEALRIRFVAGRCLVTYKGPKIDPKTKTRQEIELAWDPQVTDPSQPTQLFERLGFARVATVSKQRQTAELVSAGVRIHVDLDVVQHLGNFVELETTSSPEQLANATAALNLLARELGLHESIRESYLELLLRNDSQITSSTSVPPLHRGDNRG